MWRSSDQALLSAATRTVTHALGRQAALADVQTEARQDALTRVRNRRAFDEDLATRAAEGAPYTLALVDVDGLKGVNDAEGHAQGDRLLQVFAATLAVEVGETGQVYRLGGEEFAVLLHDCQPDAAPLVAERVRVNIEGQLARLADIPGVMTVSGGLVTARGAAPLAAADDQPYAAKAAGRNRIRLWLIVGETAASQAGGGAPA